MKALRSFKMRIAADEEQAFFSFLPDLRHLEVPRDYFL